MTDAEAKAAGMVQVGHAIPGGPCGDIWVSEALIAQVGQAEVRRMVRATYAAAYEQARARRRAEGRRASES
jgi:hypothetical protein